MIRTICLSICLSLATGGVFAQEQGENERLEQIKINLGPAYLQIINDGADRTLKDLTRRFAEEGNGTIWRQAGADALRSIERAQLRASYVQQFFSIDLNADQVISENEVVTVLNYGQRKSQMESMYTKLINADVDQNGDVSLKEFMDLIEADVESHRYRRNQNIDLRLFDLNGDGSTTLSEATNVVLVLTNRKDPETLKFE